MCPFMSQANPNNPVGLDMGYCTKDCAVYDHNTDCCGVLSISKALQQLTGKMGGMQ